MRGNWKRFISMLLAIIMLWNGVPVQSFASDIESNTDAQIVAVQTMIDALQISVTSDEEASALNVALGEVTDALAELTEEQVDQLDPTNYQAAIATLEQWSGENYGVEMTADKYDYVNFDGKTPADKELKDGKVKESELGFTSDELENGVYYYATAENKANNMWTQIKVKSGTWNGLGDDPDDELKLSDGDVVYIAERSSKWSLSGTTYTYTYKSIYRIKVYHEITASVSDAGEATGTGVSVADNGKVYHGQSSAITVNAVEGYKAEVYASNGNLVGTADGGNNWTVTISNVTDSGTYTVKYVSASAQQYNVTLTVEGSDYGTASLNKKAGITNDKIILTINLNANTDCIHYDYDVTVDGATYNEETKEITIGQTDVTVKVVFTKNELSASETADVKFNKYSEATVDKQLANDGTYYADVTNSKYLEQIILDALGVRFNGTVLKVSDVEIKYYPCREGKITGQWSYVDTAIALNRTPDLKTGFNVYSFGTSDQQEKVVITYTLGDGTTLSVTATITLVDGRKEIPTNLSTSSPTVTEDAIKEAAAKAATFATLTASDFTLEENWTDTLVSNQSVEITATANFDGNAEYQAGTVSVKVAVTKTEEPAVITVTSEGTGTGTHTIPEKSMAGIGSFTVTPTDDGSYVESVKVTCDGSTTDVELSYTDTVASGSFTVANNKSYAVTINYGKACLSVQQQDAEVALNLYVANYVDYSARMDGLKGKLLTALLGEGVTEDDYDVYVYTKPLTSFGSSGYTAVDDLTLYAAQIKDKIKVKIVKKASSDGKIPAVSVEDISVTVTDSRPEATLTPEAMDTINANGILVTTREASEETIKDTVADTVAKGLEGATVSIPDGIDWPTPENPVTTISVTVKVAESKSVQETTATVDVKLCLESYTVTWDAGDGRFDTNNEAQKLETKYYGESPTAPVTDPEKADSENGQYEYSFDKWVYLEEEDNEVELKEDYVITGNVTFYARYTETTKSYTITWNAGEGTFGGDNVKTTTTTAQWGTSAGEPGLAINAPNDKSFEKWEKTAGNVDKNGNILGEVTYTAQYSKDTIYAITWNAGDGAFKDGNHTKTTRVNVTKNETISCGEYPTRDGFVFVEWSNADHLEEGYTPNKDETFTAVWTEDTNRNGVADRNETATINVAITGADYGTVTIEKVNESDKVVITDKGNGSYTVVFDGTADGANTVKVVATPKTSENSYIKYELRTVSSENVTMDPGETYSIAAEFTKTELVLAENAKIYVNKYVGLSSDERIDGLKAKIVNALLGADAVTGNYTVVVKGTISNYDLDALSSNIGKTAVSTVLLSNSITVTVTDQSTGLSRETTLAVAESRPTLSAEVEDVKIESKTAWTEEQVKEKIKEHVTLKATDPQTGAETPITDYTISFTPSYAWPADSETETFTVTISMVEDAKQYANTLTNIKTITLTCVDTTILYTVTYKNGYNDTPIATYIIAENEPMQIPDDPNRDYHTFDGWDKEIAETVTETITYTAKWTINNDVNGNNTADEEETYTVIYKDGYSDQPVIDTFENVQWGVNTPKPESDPTRNGWNFKGWEPAVATTVTAPNSGNEIVYTATWTQKIPVTFKYADGVTKDSVAEIEKNSTVSEPEAPIWKNHIFQGWYNGDTKYVFTAPVTEAITLTAKWADDFNNNGTDDAMEAHYKITYVLYEGAENVVHDRVLTDLETPTMDDPTRTGYVFKGWNPEVAKTVTEDATYTAVWARDINENDVDDTEETITINVTTAKDSDTVTVTGAAKIDETNDWVYDSKDSNVQVSVKAVPTTDTEVLTRYSDSYVSEITINNAAQTLTYNNDYSTNVSFVPENGMQVNVTFKDAAFVLNDERILDYYPGMTGVQNKDVYETAINDPAWDDNAEIKVEYLARESGTSVKINFYNLEVSDTLKSALKLVNWDGNIEIPQTETWVTLGDTLGEFEFEGVESYEELVNNLLASKIDEIEQAYKDNGFFGILTLIKSMGEDIAQTAQYYGAHEFGYNASISNDTTETIRISYKDAERNIKATEMEITLRDNRIPTMLAGNDIELIYKNFKNSELAELMGVTVQTADGETLNGLTIVTDADIENAGASDAARDVIFKFKGNETYKPSEATFQVTIVKAEASIDIPNRIVTYGTSYNMDPTVTRNNAYGDDAEVTDSLIKFIMGLNASNLSIDENGVSGTDTVIQLILPDSLKNDLSGLIGNVFEDGVEMSLSDLVKYLELLPSDSLESLNQAIQTIIETLNVGDVTIKLGGKLPENVGAYMYGAVSTSSNYETAFDVAYIVIKPDATRVYLDFDYTASNGIFSYSMMQNTDLGASAYDDESHTTRNDAASDLIYNLFFGVNGNNELVMKLYDKTVDGSELKNALTTGAYTQLAFIAEFGNEIYYAVPTARAFLVVADMISVEITDPEGTDFIRTYDGEAQALAFEVKSNQDGYVPKDENLTVTYTGVQTNGQTYNSSEAPIHAGAYVVSAVYVERGDADEIITVGANAKLLVVKPAETATTVDDLTASVGTKVELMDQVTVTSDGKTINPQMTMITAMLSTDGTLSESGWDAVVGNVNIDLPDWVDELLKKYATEIHDGMTAGELADMIENRLDSLEKQLSDLGVSEKTIRSLTDVLAELTDTLKKIPDNATLTFDDADEMVANNVGVYMVAAIVTDSNYIPSADYGLIMILPEVEQVYLKWNYESENGIWTRELLKHADMMATAYDDPEYQYANADATQKMTCVFLTIDSQGNIKTYTDATQLENGAYIEMAYIPLEIDGKMLLSDFIARPVVLIPDTAVVEFVDENNNVNHDRRFVYDGQPHAMATQVKRNDKVITPADGELTVTYAGIMTNGETYKDVKAPVNAGAYTVTALFTRYEDGKLAYVGATVGAMVIEPAKAEISVTGGMVDYDGEEHTAKVTSRGEYTLISGTASVDGAINEIGLEAISANLNIDFPAWVDEILADKFPEAYTNGIDAAKLAEKLAEYADAMAMDGTWMDEIVTFLNKLPSGLKATFKDNIAFTEPGVYVFAGVLTDFNYVPAYDTGLLVIQKEDSGLNMMDTERVYDGNGQMIDIVNPNNLDYVTVIVDDENAVINVLLEDDLNSLKALLEKELGSELPESIDIGELQTTIQKVLDDISNIENLPVDVTSVLTQLKGVLAILPQSGVVYLNGSWRPTDVGTYAFYAMAYSTHYKTTMMQGTLEIIPRDVTITVDKQSKVYGDQDPEFTYEVSDALAKKELKITVSRKAGEDVGKYPITATVEENSNFNVEVKNAELTITAKAITEADVTLDGSLTYNGKNQTQDIKVTDGITYEVSNNTAKNAGDYKLTVAGTGNYTGTVELDWSIAKAQATVTVDRQSKIYGHKDPEFTYKVSSELAKKELKISISRQAGEDEGIYLIKATVEENSNFNVTIKNSYLTITSKDQDREDLYPIHFDQAKDDTGTIRPGAAIEIDGESYILDENCTAWVSHTNAKIVETFNYKKNDGSYQDYPVNMYVWYLTITDTDDDGTDDAYNAERVFELDNFFKYEGTSIRVNFSSNGIRFFTSVNASDTEKLIRGNLLTGKMSGYAMTTAGTLYKKATEDGEILNSGNGLSSFVYGGKVGNTFRVFANQNGRNWFTGMLTGLDDNAQTLNMDIKSRPYAVLERNGESVVIYGGTITRSVYYVATQNRDYWAAGTVYDNYIEHLIAVAESARNGN